jgi:hypothetical protein
VEYNFPDLRRDATLVIVIVVVLDGKRIGVECRKIVSEQNESTHRTLPLADNDVEAKKRNKPAKEAKHEGVFIGNDPCNDCIDSA